MNEDRVRVGEHPYGPTLIVAASGVSGIEDIVGRASSRILLTVDARFGKEECD